MRKNRFVVVSAAVGVFCGWGAFFVFVGGAEADPPVDRVNEEGTRKELRSGARARVPDSSRQSEPPADGETGGWQDAGGRNALRFDAPTSRISVQARLTDGGGGPLPGPTVDLEFRIYDGGGVLVEGPISVNAVPISSGVVAAQVPVSPSSFDGSERQLGVTVNPPAAELSPWIPLVSVPHALRVDRVASSPYTMPTEG